MEKKLRPKYQVFKVQPDGTTFHDGMNSTDPDNVDSPFVLMPRKDPAAFVAMIAYARHCEQDLANEIKAWLHQIVAAGPAPFGTQGERNFKAVRAKNLQDIL